MMTAAPPRTATIGNEPINAISHDTRRFCILLRGLQRYNQVKTAICRALIARMKRRSPQYKCFTFPLTHSLVPPPSYPGQYLYCSQLRTASMLVFIRVTVQVIYDSRKLLVFATVNLRPTKSVSFERLSPSSSHPIHLHAMALFVADQ